jgi:phosphatidylglycerophosphate synthase
LEFTGRPDVVAGTLFLVSAYNSAMDSIIIALKPITWNRRFWMVQLITTARLILSVVFPLVAVKTTTGTTLLVYLAAMATDLADGALARHWNCATRGGDWFDAFSDRMLTTMSGVYGLLVGGPTLACSLIIARDLSAASMNELQSEGSTRRARFLGILTVTPIRVVTLYVLVTKFYDVQTGEISLLYWACVSIMWSTFAVNAWLRRAIIGARFREPDIDKILR